ncbi:MAG TPA: ATP-binding protein [Steroidobacteraceae bacterium]|nr:ATP-binding protein [Steroidobacteraceae bacterium]
MSPEPDKHHEISDARLRAALAASNLGLWDWDLTTNRIFADRISCEFLGLGTEANVFDVGQLRTGCHPDDLESFGVAVRAVLEGRAPALRAVYRTRHADGRWVWIETCGSITERDASGKPTRMTGTHAAITERKQVEGALSNTLRVLNALLETLPMPVVMRDADRRVTMVNAAWEQMMRIAREDIVGKELESIPNRPPIDSLIDTDEQVRITRKSVRYETRVHAGDGTTYNVLVAKAPLFAEDGTLTGFASVVTDITEQRKTAEMLERARHEAESAMQAKSRFLANMSHELRTPLNGVVGMASLLENTALDSRQRRFVRTLRSSAEALITLINDVLDLSKAEAGKLQLAEGPVELRRELEQVVGLFSGRAHDKRIDLAAHIGHGVPAIVHGDALRLRQVLGNLVNNAIKFTESGAVLVAVTVPAGSRNQLEFSVTDSGIGIPADEQQRIFGAFEQADGSVTRRFGGTGLGLAICRQLVELMRGTMQVASAPGRGSRFSFTVPLELAAAAGAPTRAPARERAALVVGMHPVIEEAARDALAGECATVAGADSLPRALEALRQLGNQATSVRVVLESRSVENVEQAVAALRAAGGARQIEVIVLMPPDAEVRPLAGATRTLIKPLCTPDLLEAISTPDAAHSMSVRALPARGSRGRALVVEDNLVNQEMARTMLEMMGFDVITASDGREGVSYASDPTLVLILMDCQMPVMDGLAAARAIRASEPEGRRVPIVALTGNAMPGDRETCVAAGMDDYLAKPFSLTALRNTVDRWTTGKLSAAPKSGAHAPR